MYKVFSMDYGLYILVFNRWILFFTDSEVHLFLVFEKNKGIASL